MVKSKVLSGEYASESEVIRDGLRTLAARDVAVEKWLLEEVAPTFDAVIAGTEKVMTAEQTAEALRHHMEQRIQKKNSAA